MMQRDSSGTKTKEKVLLIFLLLSSIPEEKADFGLRDMKLTSEREEVKRR